MAKSTLAQGGGREITHAQKPNRLSDLDEILCVGSDPRLNHLRKFWWRSIQGFGGCVGQILLFCLYIRRRPYEHLNSTEVYVDYACTNLMIAPAIFKQNLSFRHLLLVLVLWLLRGPSIWVDAVEHVTSVMVDGTQCSHDAQTLVLCLADTRRTRVERIVHQVHTRLVPQQTFAQTI